MYLQTLMLALTARGLGDVQGARRPCPPRAAAPAAQLVTDRAAPRARAGAPAGRLLRHVVPPDESGRRATIRAPGRAPRRRRAALRLPRLVLRVHCVRASASGRTGGLGQGDRHLGNGSSICAMEPGRSIASTMGFTAADGMPMGTRCGALDPGVILYLLDEHKMDARAIERLIYNESGLLGVSGISSDMRTLLARADPSAKSPVKPANTHRRSASACAAMRHGSGSCSTQPPTRGADPASARPVAACARGWCRPMRSS